MKMHELFKALGKDEMKLKEIEELRIALGQLSAETSSLEATLNEYTRIHSKVIYFSHYSIHFHHFKFSSAMPERWRTEN